MRRAKHQSLGELLKQARESAGLSQERLATLSGVDRSYLSQLERDIKSPTVRVLLRVCKAAGVRASDLVAALEEAGRPPKKA